MKRHHARGRKHVQSTRRLFVEQLEARTLLAGDVAALDLGLATESPDSKIELLQTGVWLGPVNGRPQRGGNISVEVVEGVLLVRGDENFNSLFIQEGGASEFYLQSPNDYSLINGSSSWGFALCYGGEFQGGPLHVSGVTRGIDIDLGQGNDQVWIAGSSLPSLRVEMGEGDDEVVLNNSRNLVSFPCSLRTDVWLNFLPGPAKIDGDLIVDMGEGDDNITPSADVAGDVHIQMGEGDDRVLQSASIGASGGSVQQRLTVGGSTTIDLGPGQEDRGPPASWREDWALESKVSPALADAFNRYQAAIEAGQVLPGEEWTVPADTSYADGLPLRFAADGRLQMEFSYVAGDTELIARLKARGLHLERYSEEHGFGYAQVTEAELALFGNLRNIGQVSLRGLMYGGKWPTEFFNSPPVEIPPQPTSPPELPATEYLPPVIEEPAVPEFPVPRFPPFFDESPRSPTDPTLKPIGTQHAVSGQRLVVPVEAENPTGEPIFFNVFKPAEETIELGYGIGGNGMTVDIPVGFVGSFRMLVGIGRGEGIDSWKPLIDWELVTFEVTAPQLPEDGSQPELEETAPVMVQGGQQADILLAASHSPLDPVFFYAYAVAGQPVDLKINVWPRDGYVWVEPPAGFRGAVHVLVGIRRTDQAHETDPFVDSQIVTIHFVDPLPPPQEHPGEVWQPEPVDHARVAYSLQASNLDGSPLVGLAPGQEFVLRGFVQDLRHFPKGVFAAYLNIQWDGSLAEVIGEVAHAPLFSNGKSGDTSHDGFLGAVGGFGGMAQLGGDKYEFFSVRMRALAPGELRFEPSPIISELPSHDTLVFGESRSVLDHNLSFAGLPIRVARAAGWNDSQRETLAVGERPLPEVPTEEPAAFSFDSLPSAAFVVASNRPASLATQRASIDDLLALLATELDAATHRVKRSKL